MYERCVTDFCELNLTGQKILYYTMLELYRLEFYQTSFNEIAKQILLFCYCIRKCLDFRHVHFRKNNTRMDIIKSVW